MNDGGKSDKPIVPKKPSNKGSEQPRPAEGVEGRGLAKGNSGWHNRSWTQCQADLQHGPNWVRNAAKEDKGQRFTALWHHVYNVNRLRQAYLALKREASPGIDGETWASYGKALEENLKDLSGRLQRGAYRARPVKRVYIPKADGRQRPIGITVLEDKIVQRATTEVLNAGVMEDGAWRAADEGVPQGGSISPLLANVYLHYALDLWVQWWRQHRARGEIIIVRYADDFIVGFQYKDDAERFHGELRERLKQFNLELSEEKTRLIEFGRFADANRKGLRQNTCCKLRRGVRYGNNLRQLFRRSSLSKSFGGRESSIGTTLTRPRVLCRSATPGCRSWRCLTTSAAPSGRTGRSMVRNGTKTPRAYVTRKSSKARSAR